MWSTWYWSAWGLVKRLQRHDFPRPVTPFSLSPPDTPTTDTTTCLAASPPRLAMPTLATGSLTHTTGGQPRLTHCHKAHPSRALPLSNTPTHGHLGQSYHCATFRKGNQSPAQFTTALCTGLFSTFTTHWLVFHTIYTITGTNKLLDQNAAILFYFYFIIFSRGWSGSSVLS